MSTLVDTAGDGDDPGRRDADEDQEPTADGALFDWEHHPQDRFR